MPNSTKLANPMNVITGRDNSWFYANVWEAKSIASLIIPKNDTVTVQKIKTAIHAAYEEGQAKLKSNGRTVSPLITIKVPLRDGGTEYPNDPAYASSYFIKANSATPPGTVGADCNPITTGAPRFTPACTVVLASTTTLSTPTATRVSPAGGTTCKRSSLTANPLASSTAQHLTSLLIWIKIFRINEVCTMNATAILCILLLSLYLVLAVFWIVRSIIDTIYDRKRENSNAVLKAEREARNTKW